ncbi:MAG: hypothetical protein HW388_23 [Dehalococcoidia bacterium]|nr:hypothetical protein [Dehalococcoidia bacterium]
MKAKASSYSSIFESLLPMFGNLPATIDRYNKAPLLQILLCVIYSVLPSNHPFRLFLNIPLGKFACKLPLQFRDDFSRAPATGPRPVQYRNNCMMKVFVSHMPLRIRRRRRSGDSAGCSTSLFVLIQKSLNHCLWGIPEWLRKRLKLPIHCFTQSYSWHLALLQTFHSTP